MCILHAAVKRKMGAQKNAFPCFNEANGPFLSMEHWRM